MIIREYEEKDLKQMIDIWNEVVEEGIAFLQEKICLPRKGRGRHLSISPTPLTHPLADILR